MPRDVHDPMLPCSLLLVALLVLGDGVGVIEQRATAAAVYHIVVDANVCG
mgnify:CR=1 FL=1